MAWEEAKAAGCRRGLPTGVEEGECSSRIGMIRIERENHDVDAKHDDGCCKRRMTKQEILLASAALRKGDQ